MTLPKDFESYFRARWREEDVLALLQGLDGEPSVSIRVNPRCFAQGANADAGRAKRGLLAAGAEPEGADGHVPWCPEGFYLKGRPQFTADPLLHAGAYYVQEASSMFLAHVLRTVVMPCWPQGITTALDLCAAPGGKSTLLRALLPDDCLLVSNEPLRARCQVLAENMTKWGHQNVLVTQAYARDIAKALKRKLFFDLILADVPCSGEGMMRKEAAAVEQWSPAFVAGCADLQRSIISDIWPALRPGGILIYSTCTFNPEEDEENVEWIAHELGADIISIPVDTGWGIRGDLRREKRSPESEPGSGEAEVLRCYHFLPGQVRGEGFFCAVLQKHEEAGEAFKKGDFAGALSKLATLPTDLLDSPDAPRVELSLEEAVRYLQREALVLPPDAPRGIVQVCFQGQRLGLAKNLGTRANNLYPKEWRIRSSYTTGHTLFPA